MLTIVGNYLSPYVRLVLAVLEHKGVSYCVDPLVPFFGNDEFSKISPLRKIPVLLDSDAGLVLPETSAICEYLEEVFPEPALLSGSTAQRARARHLLAYSTGRIGEVFVWGYFYQLAVRRFVWGEEPNNERVQRSRDIDIPGIFDYLESITPQRGYLCGVVSLADIAVAAFYRNLELARYEPPANRWPNTIRLINQTLAMPAFENLRSFEELSAKTEISSQSQALRDAGAPIAEYSFIGARPMRSDSIRPGSV